MPKNYVGAIETYVKDSATLTGGFDLVVTALDEACFMIRVINASNRDVAVSYDGVHDHDFVQDGTDLQLSFQTNSRISGKVALMRKGQPIYLHAAAGSGNIYIVGYYSAI